MEATYHPSYCRFIFVFPPLFIVQFCSVELFLFRPLQGDHLLYRFCDATTMQVRLNLNLCCLEFLLFLQMNERGDFLISFFSSFSSR